MNNLAADPAYRQIRDQLETRLLDGWDPERIRSTIQTRNREKAVLKAWAQTTKPPDQFRWETKMEDNWLAKE